MTDKIKNKCYNGIRGNNITIGAKLKYKFDFRRCKEAIAINNFKLNYLLFLQTCSSEDKLKPI